jgi:ATP-dependent DNA helicase PIF1
VPQSVGEETYNGKAFLGMRAFCLLRQEDRMFRVDRILSLKTA